MFTKKQIVAGLVVIILVSIGLFTAWWQIADSDQLKPVALVDGAPISQKVLAREMKKAQDEYAMQGIFPSASELKTLKQDVLNRLVETELLWQQAVRLKIRVSDEALTMELKQMENEYVNQAILDNAMQSAEMTEEEMRSLIRKDLAIKALVDQKISNEISVSTDACKIYYHNNSEKFKTPEKIRARHILIRLDADAPVADRKKARAEIESIRRRLEQGETFEKLAYDKSQCATSADGGDLGFIARGMMGLEFDEVAFSLKLDEVSPIVKSSMGYHIIKVTDRQPSRTISFDEAQDVIEQYLLDQKIHDGVKKYLAGLKDKAKVQRFIQ